MSLVVAIGSRLEANATRAVSAARLGSRKDGKQPSVRSLGIRGYTLPARICQSRPKKLFLCTRCPVLLSRAGPAFAPTSKACLNRPLQDRAPVW